jgi:hypothetical protein
MFRRCAIGIASVGDRGTAVGGCRQSGLMAHAPMTGDCIERT